MTAVRRVPLEALTREAFAPFGDLIAADDAAGRPINSGTTMRFDWTTLPQGDRPGARPNLAVFRSRPQALPLRVTLLERHPHSTQLLVPIRVSRWVAVVAPDGPGDTPDTSGLRAFVVLAGQSVNLRKGVWHHPVTVLDEPAELLMLAWEDGGAGDCETRLLEVPIEVG